MVYRPITDKSKVIGRGQGKTKTEPPKYFVLYSNDLRVGFKNKSPKQIARLVQGVVTRFKKAHLSEASADTSISATGDTFMVTSTDSRFLENLPFKFGNFTRSSVQKVTTYTTCN